MSLTWVHRGTGDILIDLCPLHALSGCSYIDAGNLVMVWQLSGDMVSNMDISRPFNAPPKPHTGLSRLLNHSQVKGLNLAHTLLSRTNIDACAFGRNRNLDTLCIQLQLPARFSSQVQIPHPLTLVVLFW